MLYYITYTHIPTKKAFGYAIAKMSASFAEIEPVTLVIPRDRYSEIDESISDFYSVPNNFKIIELPCIDLFRFTFLGKHIPFLIRKISFALSLFFRLDLTQQDICYSRDIWSLAFLRLKTNNLFLEIHYLSHIDALSIRLAHSANKIVVITSFLKQELITLGYKAEDILVAPDAVDLAEYKAINSSKEQLRQKLQLPQHEKLVLYSGNLFAWKGVYTLVDAFKDMTSNTKLVIVGGSEDTLPEFKNYVATKSYAENIIVVGYKKHAEIASYLKAADIVVLPNSAKTTLSKYNTSPLKLFEYMASGVPIITSDVPSAREILNESNAFFAEADNSDSLRLTINSVLSNTSEAEVKAHQALRDVEKYDWKMRASAISAHVHGGMKNYYILMRYARVIRYLYTGGFTTALNIFTLFFCVRILGFWYLASAIISFIVSVIASYLLQKFWTFKHTKRDDMHIEFSKYVLYAILMLGVNTGLMYIAVDILNIWYLLAQIIISACIAFLNYAFYRFFFVTEKAQ